MTRLNIVDNHSIVMFYPSKTDRDAGIVNWHPMPESSKVIFHTAPTISRCTQMTKLAGQIISKAVPLLAAAAITTMCVTQ